jgi:hypothetical protein
VRTLQHNDREPQAWSETLHHHIGWDFGGDIERKENGQRNIILDRLGTLFGHAQVLLKTEEFGISDIGSVQEGKAEELVHARSSVFSIKAVENKIYIQVEKRKKWNQMPVQLSYQLLGS